MPTRTAFVLTIGDVIESGPPTVTPSNRRNASAPNSPRSGSMGALNVHYKRSVSTSSKLNGRNGGSRGRSNGHYKQSSNFVPVVNGKNDSEVSENNEVFESAQCLVSSDNTDKILASTIDSVSDSENSNDSSDLIFSTTPDESGSNTNVKKIARMKTRHVSTSSVTSIANGNSQPSHVPLGQIAKTSSSNKPKKSIMKPSRIAQDEDDEVSFSDSAAAPSILCNGTSHSASRPGPACSKVGVRKRKTAAEKFLEDNADYYGIQVLPSKLRNHSYTPTSNTSAINKWNPPLSATYKSSSHENMPNPEQDSFSTSICVSSSTTWITVGCRHSSNNSFNLHESTNLHSCRPSRSNSMDLGVVGTATTNLALLSQDGKTVGWPGYVQDRDRAAERRKFRHKSCSDQLLQEKSRENETTTSVLPNDNILTQESPAQNSVISSIHSNAVNSPYVTRKRLSSSCLSNGSNKNDNEDLSSPNSRQTRVNTTKTTERFIHENDQGGGKTSEVEADSPKEISEHFEGKRKRKNSDCNDNDNKRMRKISESWDADISRKRRTELDKLLDAGSSSFHFETAKQTAERLGPIHIDVNGVKDGNHSNSDEDESLSEAERRRPPGWLTIPSKKKKNPKDSRASPKKQRLLKKVSPGVSSAGKDAAQAKITQFFPKTSGRKVLSPKSIPPPPKRNRGKFLFKKHEMEETEDESDSNDTRPYSYLASSILKAIDDELALVDGTEAPIDSLRFSFEHTPAREGWFQTYTRQDQGDEILYYPEPKSFPLPYEMPISTFYPGRDKGENGETRKGKSKWPSSKSSSKDTSVNPSGAVTPIAACPVPYKEVEIETSKGRAKASSLATALAASSRLKEALTTSRKTRCGRSESSSTQSSQSNHLERKSPRGHASTKSLISACMGGSGIDNPLELVDDIDNCNPIINEDASNNFKMLDDQIELYDNKSNCSPTILTDLQLPIEQSTIDECSNDSWAPSEYGNKSGKHRNATPVQEDIQEYKEISLELDSYLFDGELTMLEGTANPPATINPSNLSSPHPLNSVESNIGTDNSVRNIRQRQRSSGSSHSTDKPVRIHKHHKHKHDKTKHRNRSEQMDHVVASNVDQVLLDCLEDELPGGIVAIEGEIPGSSPLELLSNFEGCDSMVYARSSRRWSKPRPFQDHSTTDRKSELRAVFGGRGMGYLSPTRMKADDYYNDEIKHSLQHSISESTILKRLLTDGLPSMNGSNHIGKKIYHKPISEGLMLPPPPVNTEGGYSSSEDTASVCSSSVTTTSQSSDASGPSKRKKKRNLTGFPSPKKKRKKTLTEVTTLKKPAGKAPRVRLLTAVLTQNAKNAAKAKKNQKLSSGKRKNLSKSVQNKSGRLKKTTLRSAQQERSSDVEGTESDASQSDSDEEVSGSGIESTTTPRRGRPPSKNQDGKKLLSAKPKKGSSPKTEWQKAKALVKERALAENKTKGKNIKPKKIVVSRKAYAAYKKARLAEAAAAAAATASKTKRSSPNKSKKSPGGGAKSKQNKKSLKVCGIKSVDSKLDLEIDEYTQEGDTEEREEDSVHADAEDEESEEEFESVKPHGWLTIPKGKSALCKKMGKQRKGNINSRAAFKKPKLRNCNMRTKQKAPVSNKNCRLT